MRIPLRYLECVFTKRFRISESARFYTRKNTGFLVRFHTVIKAPLRYGPIADRTRGANYERKIHGDPYFHMLARPFSRCVGRSLMPQWVFRAATWRFFDFVLHYKEVLRYTI